MDLTYVPVDCFTVDRRVAGLLPLAGRAAEPGDGVQMVQRVRPSLRSVFQTAAVDFTDCRLPPAPQTKPGRPTEGVTETKRVG